MQKHTLSVTNREVFGKKVKKLRKEGVLPGNIYGHNFASVAVQMPTKEFEEVFEKAGHSGVVELKLDGKAIPTLIHEVTHNHVSQSVLHVDFYKVNLKEKVKAVVPVILIGEPTAVTEKLGLLMHSLNEVEVEALPTDLPEHIEVDVTPLAEVGASIHVSDLKVPAEVTIVTTGEHEVARIAELVSHEAEEQAAEEAAASEEGTALAEGEEGTTPAAETDTPATEE